jgi:hypothetical protein
MLERGNFDQHIHTHMHARTLTQPLSISNSPKNPYKRTCASPERKCNQKLEISVAQGYDRIQKNKLETKKRKHDPWEEKNFLYLHKKKKCDAHPRAPELLTVRERILPPLSSKLEAIKKTPGIADRSSAQYPSLKMQESIRKRTIESQKRALGLLRARNPCAFLLTQHTTLSHTDTHTQTLINAIC